MDLKWLQEATASHRWFFPLGAHSAERLSGRITKPAVSWNTVKMCEHARAQCLIGRLTLQPLSLAKQNSRAQTPENSPECSSEVLLAPKQTQQTAMDCKNTTGQPEQTNLTNVDTQRDC
ncbi:hypothetical protein ILYODFUR_012961 [Ilyodon furcidens]|uniref:Uncharacterized protein n=1 Tax=Ilyodon furcidens TaxID=33524 RepID=A0ABV0TIC8_9TELE